MFDKLKKLFKSKNKEVEHDSSTVDRIEYTEKLNWGILPDNPSKVSMFQSLRKNHDIIIVDFLYDLLTEKGWKVHMINDERNEMAVCS